MSFEGTQLGRYHLHQVLGSGGMGEVYLADDSRINRQVAIKVVRSEPSLYPDSESSRQAALLFEREMQVISQLDHPHILPLYDYGEAEVSGTTITYMVMPYRPEGSLTSWLHQRKSSAPLSPQDVATLIGQAASALQHTHERRVIHQDVKPSNFLIRIRPEEPEHPDLLLTDFGISRFMAGHSSTSQTIRGTPTYMAPEQWEGRPTYASDQYALAVMTYELLIGHPPFEGRSEPIWFKHLHVTPPAPSSLNTSLPPGIDAVLLHALAKKPEERFASVSAFAS
ncbi:MAG TPA: serine/threonine-protein kinase, partial [Ktedonobacteraceae bacterium]|nr:serine/threonine-protein kinase [Ktedonobacteraceae bacterium]